jgi:hypothetical protein
MLMSPPPTPTPLLRALQSMMNLVSFTIDRHWSRSCDFHLHLAVYVWQQSLKASQQLRPLRGRLWLKQYAASRKVAGSSPDEVDFLNWPNLSGRTMALGSTQPLTEMSTRNL